MLRRTAGELPGIGDGGFGRDAVGETAMMADDFLNRVYGCLVGGAIGDALGAPVENWHYNDMGCIVGALHGASALRPDWITQVENANRAFFAETGHDCGPGFRATAERLVDVVAEQQRQTVQRLRLLGTLLPQA